MSEWSYESLKNGFNLTKDIKDMTEEELVIFRNSFEPDTMGFDGVEYIGEGE